MHLYGGTHRCIGAFFIVKKYLAQTINDVDRHLRKFVPYNTNQIFGGFIMADKEIKLVFSKTEDGKNLLVLSSVYQHNCSGQETVIIDDDVLEVFQQTCRDKERERSWRRRHGNRFIYLGSDENFDAKLGLTVDAPDEAVESKLYLEYIRQFFDEKVYRRGIMYYLHKYSQDEIAELEGVSQMAISKSIARFKEVMAKLYKNRLK